MTIKSIQKEPSLKNKSYREWIQFGFLLITLWIGIEFIIWISQLESGIVPKISRPPGVEAFLPISALISLKYWLLSGIFNTIHPSALVLLLIILSTALLLKKGFCSWVCPIGLLSEWLAKINRKIFNRQIGLPAWLDYPLRSVKYWLLLFFGWAVFGQMNKIALQKFIYSPYNKVADIKMLKFFSEINDTTFWVLLILFLLSLALPYFWCRYLCPYGALLGALSWLSLFKVHRNQHNCIDCEKCTKVCPAAIKVHRSRTVFSDECFACFKCIDVCPVENTLNFSVTKNRYKFSKKTYAIILILLFLIGTSTARLFGVWKNEITTGEYLYHIKNLDHPAYQHNRGQVPEYQNNPESEKTENNTFQDLYQSRESQK